MSVLAQRSNVIALPGGLWPSLLVLTLVGVVPLTVLLVGYSIMTVFRGDSQFLPEYRVPWFIESVIEYKMDYALHSTEYNDVIFLGASATLAGVVPSSFEEATGMVAYNFGTGIDIGPDGHLEMLRAYLKSHPRPRLLVYTTFARDLGDAGPTDVYLRGRFVEAYGPVLRSREDLPQEGPKFYFQEGFWFLYQLVKTGFQHPYDAPRGDRPTHREVGPLLVQERGYQQHPQARFLNLDYLEEMKALQISQWYQDSFVEMAQLAHENEIPLVVWIMPIPSPGSPPTDTPLISWAEQFQAENPGAMVIGLPVQQYDNQLWANPFHLNREGAELFTGQISDNVTALLDQIPGDQP